MESLNKQYLYLALVISLIALILSSALATGDLEAKTIKVREGDKGYLALFDNPTGKQKIKTGGTSGLYYENNRLYIGDVDLDGNKTYIGETGLVIETGAGTCATLGAASGASGIFRLPAGVNGGTIALEGGSTDIEITRLDIDGGTDIGADLVDGDLIIVDDGAAGNNKKCEVSRLKTYIGSGTSTIDGLNDAKAGGTNFTDSIKIGSATTGTLNDAKQNTALGIGAMDSITTGDNNIMIGFDAGSIVTSASSNILIGTCAGAKLTTNSYSNDNTFIGTNAGRYNPQGYNVIIGADSLFSSSANSAYSVIIGYRAAAYAQTSWYNTFVGHNSGYQCQGSLNSYNTFVGYNSGYRVTTGLRNTFLGAIDSISLFDLYTGDNNSCLGYSTLPSSLAASNEIVLGNEDITSLRCQGISVVSDSQLTFVGFGMCTEYNVGNGNTFIGHGISAVGAGNNNTFLGASIIGSNAGDNNTLIGFGASISSGSNTIILGNDDITSLKCAQPTITTLSDRRDKKDIIDNPYGIEFIEKVRPVQFTWNKRTNSSINGTKRLGFIAQELQEAMDENDNDILNLVYDSNPDRLEVTQGNLLPILVKAVQDLKKEVDLLKSRL